MLWALSRLIAVLVSRLRTGSCLCEMESEFGLTLQVDWTDKEAVFFGNVECGFGCTYVCCLQFAVAECRAAEDCIQRDGTASWQWAAL